MLIIFRSLHCATRCCKRLNDRSTHTENWQSTLAAWPAKTVKHQQLGAPINTASDRWSEAGKGGQDWRRGRVGGPSTVHGVPPLQMQSTTIQNPVFKASNSKRLSPLPTHTHTLSLTHMSHSDCSYFSFSYFSLFSYSFHATNGDEREGWKNRSRKYPHEAVNNIPNVLLRRVYLLLPSNKPSI